MDDIREITAPLRLAVGSHKQGSGKGCLMNIVSWANGDTKITDMPACADPFLSRVNQKLNDTICTHRDGDLLCVDCTQIVLPFGWASVGTAGVATAQDYARLAAMAAEDVNHLRNGNAAAYAAHVAADFAADYAARAAADADAHAAAAAAVAADADAATDAAARAAYARAYADAAADDAAARAAYVADAAAAAYVAAADAAAAHAGTVAARAAAHAADVADDAAADDADDAAAYAALWHARWVEVTGHDLATTRPAGWVEAEQKMVAS